MSSPATTLSNSKLRTSTPVRAITSKIGSKSSPFIPPASQSYDPLVKSVLRHRLSHIFLYSALLAWLIGTYWTIWQSGGVSTLGLSGVVIAPFLPSTVVSSLLGWLTTALPVIVLRKVFLTATRTPTTSPLNSIKASLAKTSTKAALAVYVASSLSVTLIHATTAYVVEEHDPKLSLFVKSKKHPHYLNGRLVFLLFTQVVTALVFLFRNIMYDRFVFRWQLAHVDIRPFGIYHFVVAVLISVFTISNSLPLAALLFATARFLLPILYKLPILPIFLRPFTAHFLRGSWTLFLPLRHFSLIFRAWFLGFTTVFIWEAAESLFETLVSVPVTITHLTADPNLTLVSGVSSSDVTFKFFALSELKAAATEDTLTASARRTALFGDQKNIPNLWSQIAQECLNLLEHDYQLFLRRGQPAPATPPPPPAKTTPLEDKVPATPAQVIRGPVFRSASKASPTILDAFAADGPFARAVDTGAEAVHVPEIFRSLENRVMLTPAKKEKKEEAKKEEKPGLVARVKAEIDMAVRSAAEKHVPIPARELWQEWLVWLKTERTSRVVDACLPLRELDVVAIEVLSHLTCASLTEDRYGVVQRDIPKILETMLSFLSAIEEYQVELNKLYVPPTPEDNLSQKDLYERERIRGEVEKAGEVLSYVGDGLKDGVARIVRTFGKKLLAFKFPPRTAQKLQGFLDYCG